MGCPDFHWQHIPLLELWRERHDSDGKSHIILESYPPGEGIEILKEALANNKVSASSSSHCKQISETKL